MESSAMKLARAMQEAPDSVSSEEVVPDSEMARQDLVLDSTASQELELNSTTPQYLEPDSSAQRDFVPDSLPPESQPSTCVRCGTTHDCNDVEGCRLARRLASRCVRCGLVQWRMQDGNRGGAKTMEILICMKIQ
jgi:hypothetical protein